ncbi:MAG: methyltransferase domain-containing protein [Candidatus Mycalebacterium zealandia]|nr:MAG: methyltransferase domain-containing protein [Candidatus Mycalebacterium zealandia]
MENYSKNLENLASRYRSLRITDKEPVDFVINNLPASGVIQATDTGCGAGRYAKLFLEALGERVFLNCFDTNEYMLDQLKTYLTEGGFSNFSAKLADARDVPLEQSSVDAVFCFNSIHHIGIVGFLQEVSRILKTGGRVFIYTRSRVQNDRTVWGLHFPLFRRKESRLYEPDEFEFKVEKFPEFEIELTKTFTYDRVNSPEDLAEKASEKAYSAFLFYEPEEFVRAFERFRANLKQSFDGDIEWEDGKIMYVLTKTS